MYGICILCSRLLTCLTDRRAGAAVVLVYATANLLKSMQHLLLILTYLL